MLDSLRWGSGTEPGQEPATITERPRPKAITRATFFRLGRLVYGGILAMLAVDGLRNVEQRTQSAAAKGVPMPKYAHVISHVLLLLGSVGISLWRAPKLATGAVVTFLLGVTPPMHDFWAIDDPEQRQQETFHFLKNTALLGTALAFFGVARRTERLEARRG